MFITGGVAAVVAAFSAIGVYYEYCTYKECCKPPWVSSLQSERATAYYSFPEVFGQPLAVKLVRQLSETRSKQKQTKPLVLSFHGPTGVGKSFVSSVIARLLFKYGEKSNYYSFYSPGMRFPNPLKLYDYREMLIQEITEKLKECDKSVFIFDEFQNVPQGLHIAIAPFLEAHPTIPNSQATFIFTSNTGMKGIIHKCTELNRDGIERNNYKLSDFEEDLEKAVYNEESSWKGSPIVERYLIDAYIPFLPLKAQHVQECIKAEFQELNGTIPQPNEIAKIMKKVPFSEDGVYSISGCRRVQRLVSDYLFETREFQ